MTKTERHLRAEKLRKKISTQAYRREIINEIIAKESYDETDRLCIKILLNKLINVEGCESEYKKLIAHLYQWADLKNMAEDFYKKWNAK